MKLGLVALVLAGSMAGAQSAQRVTITQAEIKAAGWQRISDVLDASTGWRLASTDGFTFTPSPDGLPLAGESAIGTPGVTILVDGAPVPVTMFGQQELEFLPVQLAQVDSVVLTSEPALVAGRIASRGVLQFFSHHPDHAFGQGSIQLGDVANKPGPYKLTPLNPPNREHLGPFWNLLFGYGNDRVGFDAGLRYATLNTTDSLIEARAHVGATAATSQINLPAPTVHLDILALGGKQSFDATKAHYSGLYFIPAYGHEQSLRMNATTITGAGNAALPLAVGFDYRGTYVDDDVTPLPTGYPSTLTHRRRNLDLGVDFSKDFGPLSAQIGADADRWTADRVPFRGALGSQEDDRLSALVRQGTERWTNTFGAALTRGAGAYALGGTLRSALTFGADQIAFSAAAEPERFGQDGAWIDTGLVQNPPPTQSLCSCVARAYGVATVQRLSSATLDLSHSLSAAVRALAGVQVLRASGWPTSLPSDTGFFELQGEQPPSPQSGVLDVVSFRAGVETPRSERSYGRLLYSYVRPVGGDTTLQTASRSVARHQLTGQAWLVPATDWRVSTLVQFLTPAYWSSFPALPNGFPPTVEPMHRIDLSAEKWIWSRHVRLQYLVRDILNGTERWQPRSAQMNLRWLALVSFSSRGD